MFATVGEEIIPTVWDSIDCELSYWIGAGLILLLVGLMTASSCVFVLTLCVDIESSDDLRHHYSHLIELNQ